MMDDLRQAMAVDEHEPEFGVELIRRIYSAASASAVFSEPMTHGDYMVLTASEVGAGGGFGFGRGFGIDASGNMTSARDGSSRGGGTGGGGGGGAGGRPVAVIEIGPNGVRVKPVVDVTKLALGAISAWIAIGLAFRGARAASRLPWKR